MTRKSGENIKVQEFDDDGECKSFKLSKGYALVILNNNKEVIAAQSILRPSPAFRLRMVT